MQSVVRMLHSFLDFYPKKRNDPSLLLHLHGPHWFSLVLDKTQSQREIQRIYVCVYVRCTPVFCFVCTRLCVDMFLRSFVLQEDVAVSAYKKTSSLFHFIPLFLNKNFRPQFTWKLQDCSCRNIYSNPAGRMECSQVILSPSKRDFFFFFHPDIDPVKSTMLECGACF